MKCPYCGVGIVGKDNCSECVWPYSVVGWKSFKRNVKRLTLDTGCINAKEKNSALNTLESWIKEGKIETQRASPFLKEFRGPDRHVKKAQQIPKPPPLFRLGGSMLGGGDILAGPDLKDEISKILFPTVKTLNQNQENDVQHLHEHIQSGGDIFVTLNPNDFMVDDKQEKLREIGVWVLTPKETVNLLRDLYEWT